jgi:TolA-binding protein
MKKEERHQIKRDELMTVLERAEHFVEDNVRRVLIIAGAALLLVVAGLGLRSWLVGRETRGAAMLGEVIRTYRSPVASSLDALQDAPPGTTPFTTAADRDRKVLDQADALLAACPGTKAAPKARYYRGLALAALGRGDEAVAAFEDFLKRHPSDFVAPMARLQLAHLREARGETAEALAHYEALAGQAGAFPPEEGILGTARCQEALGRKDEALKTYRRVVSEFPDSEYASEARRKVDDLS